MNFPTLYEVKIQTKPHHTTTCLTTSPSAKEDAWGQPLPKGKRVDFVECTPFASSFAENCPECDATGKSLNLISREFTRCPTCHGNTGIIPDLPSNLIRTA